MKQIAFFLSFIFSTQYPLTLHATNTTFYDEIRYSMTNEVQECPPQKTDNGSFIFYISMWPFTALMATVAAVALAHFAMKCYQPSLLISDIEGGGGGTISTETPLSLDHPIPSAPPFGSGYGTINDDSTLK